MLCLSTQFSFCLEGKLPVMRPVSCRFPCQPGSPVLLGPPTSGVAAALSFSVHLPPQPHSSDAGSGGPWEDKADASRHWLLPSCHYPAESLHTARGLPGHQQDSQPAAWEAKLLGPSRSHTCDWLPLLDTEQGGGMDGFGFSFSYKNRTSPNCMEHDELQATKGIQQLSWDTCDQ